MIVCKVYSNQKLTQMNKRMKIWICTKIPSSAITAPQLKDMEKKRKAAACPSVALSPVSTTDKPILKEALQSDEKNEWMKAKYLELSILNKCQTWDLVPRPTRKKVLSSKVILKVNPQADNIIAKFKARKVALGLNQSDGDFGKKNSPVVDFTVLRLFLALSALKDFHSTPFEVKKAFVLENLEEEIPFELITGFEDSKHSDYVCRLLKCFMNGNKHHAYGSTTSRTICYLLVLNE